MTIQFVGFVSELHAGDGGTVIVRVQAEIDRGLGKVVMFKVPRSEAQHWLPGRTVQFTAYTLPEPQP